MANNKKTFEAYSYRTSSRFGSRLKVSVDNGMITVAGPRIGIITYRLWIAVQALLLALVAPALLAAAFLRDWRYLLLALVLAVVHLLFGGSGAASFWEVANLVAFDIGYQTTSFPVSAVKRVKIGRGWARKGMWLVILPYVAQINKMTEEQVVSFEAPDGDTGKDAVYAFYMHDKDDAIALAGLLEGK